MTDLEERLMKLVEDLRAENQALTEIILESQNLLPKEVKVSSTEGTGKLPWHIRQKNLTKLFRKEENQEEKNEE